MPGNHSEISLNEQNRVDNNSYDTKMKTTTKKKKKKYLTIVDDSDFDSPSPLAMSSISKSMNRFIPKIGKKPKSPKRCSSSTCSSRSGSRKVGCFRVMRPRRSDKDDGSSVSSPTSDPNNGRFCHEMLRVMLETNDFCSIECNPHR